MNTPIRIFLAAIAIFAVLSLSACKDEDNPFRRKPVTPEQNNPQWRYYHNYKMFEHESRVLKDYLTGNRNAVRASWARLKEYLLSMKENMPEDKGFEFLELYDAYDKAISDHLEKYRSGEATLSRVESLNYRIEKDYHYSKVWPDWRP
ncbi:MAG: hypothetical protein Kow00107_02600 [Planctomycetota bacterium]